jgi:hypothetical protein
MHISQRKTNNTFMNVVTVLTQPFRKASAEGHSRVDPASSIINKVPRSWEHDGHFDKCLHVGPYSRADNQVCDDHVSRTTVRQCFACADKQTATDIGAEGDDLLDSVSCDLAFDAEVVFMSCGLTWSFRELILAWSVPRSCLIESDPDSTSVVCGSSWPCFSVPLYS